MQIQEEAVSFTEEAEVRMQELSEFLARRTRINIAVVGQIDDADMLLTPGAFLMLVIPLIEAADQSVTPDAVRESVRRLLETMKSDPAPSDARFESSDARRLVIGRKPRLFRKSRPSTQLGPRDHLRSSQSVIRAYWKRFCTIRPYCSEGGADST